MDERDAKRISDQALLGSIPTDAATLLVKHRAAVQDLIWLKNELARCPFPTQQRVYRRKVHTAQALVSLLFALYCEARADEEAQPQPEGPPTPGPATLRRSGI